MQSSDAKHRFQRLAASMAIALITSGALVVTSAPPSFAGPPAHAGKPDHAGKGGKAGKHKKHGKHGGRDEGRRGDGGQSGAIGVDIIFGESERGHIRDHYRDGYAAQSCPPGLAKKRNGCLPPGQAKKTYRKGDAIPDDVVLLPIPDRLRIRLKPLPAGYFYRYVDGQVLVVAKAAKKVIDAVVLLSTL